MGAKNMLTVTDLLGRKAAFKRVRTGSELLLLVELDKYCNLLLGERLDTSDLKVLKSLHNYPLIKLVVKKIDLNLEYDQMVETPANQKILFFEHDVLDVDIKKSAKEWTYNFASNMLANLKLNNVDKSHGYVSLYAYMVVSAYKNKTPVPKLIIDNRTHVQLPMDFVDLLILQEYGSCILKGKVDIRMHSDYLITNTKNEKHPAQPLWEAYLMYHRQHGRMSKPATSREKLKYIKKEFKEGSVVLMYKRNKGAKGTNINTLKSCYPGVIREIGKDFVKIESYSLIETELTAQYIREQQELQGVAEIALTGITFRGSLERFDLLTIGVNTLTYDEEDFFLKVIDADGTYQIELDSEGNRRKVYYSTIETVYRLFEDRGVVYDKAGYIEEYFKGVVPNFEVKILKGERVD